jgi:hypothetical protein
VSCRVRELDWPGPPLARIEPTTEFVHPTT